MNLGQRCFSGHQHQPPALLQGYVCRACDETVGVARANGGHGLHAAGHHDCCVGGE
ncbi:Uncharacterised protein [Mycobacteroides abscessus subsp. abscessus]|nr:Uncharacterised protein [Mycobacteroides abscessus subsp. abscessus]